MVSSIKPLNLKEALELYDILGKYIPEASVDESVLEFVGTIVNRIAEDYSNAYIEAICLMTKCTLRDLQNLTPKEQIILFADELVANHIIELNKFCKDIDYG